jgi:hypothetical protein
LTRSKALEGFATITGIIDKNSPCAKTTTIIATVYDKKDGQPMKNQVSYTGRIVLPDQFELIMGVLKEARDKGSPPILAWNNADLAAILLDTPVGLDFQPVKLAGSEVERGDRIIIVGYAAGNSPHFHGDRQSGGNMVTGLISLETGSTLLETALQELPEGGVASYAEEGDSGGACIQKANQSMLVGFVSAGGTRRKDGGRVSYCTSVYSHKAWLEQLLEKADKS